MISLKTKLAAYFLLLALLPAAAAFWGFSSLAKHDETRRVDTRLETELRTTLAGYQARLGAAETAATRLARTKALERLIVRRDRSGLAQFLAGRPNVAVVLPGGIRVGADPPALGAERKANVRTTDGLAGSVVVTVPIDAQLAQRLRTAANLEVDDTVAILRASRIVASAPPLSGDIGASAGAPRSVTIGGVAYRVLVAGPLGDFPGERIAVLSPGSLIGAANGSSRLRLLLLLLAMLAVIAAASFIEGRAIVRTLQGLVSAVNAIARGRLDERVPVKGRDELAQLGRAFNDMANQLERRIEELGQERARLSAAIDRIGETLEATHDTDQLLHVVVETALEATGASSAVLTTPQGVLRTGEPEPGDKHLQLPLVAGATTFGTLTLLAPRFDEEQVHVANSFAAQAVVALENARLHAIVARQAQVDGLTGLANRRHLEEVLAHELARARRFDTPLSIVMADLDDFKTVNDRHGHAAGDLVLRELAGILEGSVRDVDVAGRWGGEEFLLVLPGTDEQGAKQAAERIRAALEATTVHSSGDVLRVTASFGVASYTAGITSEALFEHADQALYRAKAAGKNRIG